MRERWEGQMEVASGANHHAEKLVQNAFFFSSNALIGNNVLYVDMKKSKDSPKMICGNFPASIGQN